MSELVTKSVPQGQQEQRAAAAAVLAVVGAVFLYAQSQDNGKYSLVSPGGIAFSDFIGYEDLAVVSSAHTDERLKVIVGNPTMIKAFKAGIPLNGQPFPDGSKVVKLSGRRRRAPRPLRRGCARRV
jgi:hypothetical protein